MDGEGEKDGEKEKAGTFAQDSSRNIPHGLAPVADRDYESSKIVDRTDQNGSEENPEESWYPAPDDGEGRSDDRSGSCNTGKVMAKDDTLAGGDVVVAVLHLY